jgi:hypothetical protein
MEFLDISSTKDTSLLFPAIDNPYFWQMLQKTILYSGFKIHTKKSTKQENLSLFVNGILCKTKKRG